jgi:hypothetical protein
MTATRPIKLRLGLALGINGFLLAWMPQMAATSGREPFDKVFVGTAIAVVALAAAAPVFFKANWKFRIIAVVSIILPVVLLAHALIARAKL